MTRAHSVAAFRALASQELHALFVSPVGWAALASIQFVIGIVFVVQLQVFLDPPQVSVLGETWGLTRVVVAPLGTWGAFLFALVIPLLTMRAFGGGSDAGTTTLLLASPAPAVVIVLGKFTGLMVFVCAQVVCIGILPSLLLLGSQLDTGLLASQALGLALVGAMFCALGLLMSSLTRQPLLAASSTIAVLMLLWILSLRSSSALTTAQEWIHRTSWQIHLQPMLRGLVDTADITYFLVVTTGALVVCTRRINRFRRTG